ncbi:MAG: hypothetical protein QME52_05810 [Bacteroidota bacterium]|nr:hypothetical protein [Bacteroidota bacterium]
MNLTIKWILISWISFSFIGCSSSPLVRYPNFTERKKNFSSTVILTDFIIINTNIENTGIVNLIENQDYAKKCLQFLAGKMNEKGYNVNRVHLTSMGLLMNKDQSYQVMKSSEEQQLTTAPFYISDIFHEDTIKKQILNKVYSSLIGYEKQKGEANNVIPAAKYLGKIFGNDMIAVVFVGGYNVSATKQYGHYIPPSSSTLDKTSIQQTSQYSMILFLIDASSGEMIWDDRIYKKGGQMYFEKLQNMIESLVNELP